MIYEKLIYEQRVPSSPSTTQSLEEQGTASCGKIARVGTLRSNLQTQRMDVLVRNVLAVFAVLGLRR